jgi:hypothetical protein
MAAIEVGDVGDEALCVAYADEVRAVIRHLIDSSKYSYKTLAERVGLREHTLYQFLSRDTIRPKYNVTLHELFLFVQDDMEPSIVGDRPDISNLVKKIRCTKKNSAATIAPAFASFIRSMDSSFNRINRVVRVLVGRYHVYRFSVRSNRVVKTQLDISYDSAYDKLGLFKHRYVDITGSERITIGYIMVTIGTVYLIGKIGRGFGLEVISFSEPVSEEPSLIPALTMTTDTRNQPIVARCVLRKVSLEVEDDSIGAFNLDGSEAEELPYHRNKISDENISAEIDFVRSIEPLMSGPSARNRCIGLNLV